MHDYSKLFNHLAQYAPDQVDTDDNKKGPLHDWPLHQAIGAHDAQHGRVIPRICQQRYHRGRCELRP
jgi:hypothetical protein